MVFAAILMPLLLTGCGKKEQGGEKKTAQKNEDAFLDKDAKPDERKYLVATRPFFIAVGSRKYAEAYALLSSHAKARMSLNQFTPAQQEADFQRNESYPFVNVTAEQFVGLMGYVEAAHGTPRAPKMLHVFSTNPDVLSRRSKEQFGAMDSMFAIGAMPDWISRQHPTREFAGANPHGTVTAGTSEGCEPAGRQRGGVEERPGL
jgi:hypothetical protein